MKIFLTVGSQKFQFNRLLRQIDLLVQEGRMKDEIFAQTGYCDYTPKYYRFKQFLDRDACEENIKEADIVITHGGTGAIINAVKQEKKVIAVPRLARYGEHVDDHQTQILKEFEEMNLICACNNVENLEQALEEVKHCSYAKYDSNTHTIIGSIEDYIEDLKK